MHRNEFLFHVIVPSLEQHEDEVIRVLHGANRVFPRRSYSTGFHPVGVCFGGKILRGTIR